MLRPLGFFFCKNCTQNAFLIKAILVHIWSMLFEEHFIGIHGLILGLRPANERRRYKVTPSLIGWAQT